MLKNKTKILFFGTPNFAVGVLDELVKNKYNIIGVVTSVDKKAGRGKKLRISAVKKYALEHDILVLQPENLKSEAFNTQLKKLKAALQIIVAFRMLPKVVWDMPRMGTFNLHASLLPSYRGAAPINWAIINGETKTGVTTFFIDEKIDTGEILLQDSIPITLEETAESLHDKLMLIGGKLVVKTIKLLETDNFSTQKQPNLAQKKAPKLYKNTTKIEWNDKLVNIQNKVRGLSSYPAAWCEFISNDTLYTMKLYKTHLEYRDHSIEIGTLITTKKSLKVAHQEGYLILDEVQLSGKKRMDINNLLNGFSIANNARMII